MIPLPGPDSPQVEDTTSIELIEFRTNHMIRNKFYQNRKKGGSDHKMPTGRFYTNQALELWTSYKKLFRKNDQNDF